MEELNIFNGYLTGEERAYAIEVAEANNMIDKGIALLEMCIIQGEQIKKDAELKVFKESGTYDDYAYLMEEAEKATGEKKQGALATIVEGLKQLISSIFGAIRGIFKKADPEATVEVDKESQGILNWMSNAATSIKELPAAIMSGDSDKVKEVVTKVGVPVAVTAGGAAAVTMTVKQINEKFDILDKASKTISTTIDAIKSWGGEELDKHPKIKSVINEVQSFLNSKIAPALNKIGALIGKAGQAVKDGTEAVKNKVTGKKNEQPADQQQTAPATDTNNPQATPPQQGAPTPVQSAAPQQIQAQAASNYATNQPQPQQMQTRAYTANPNERDQGRQYTINLQGQVVGIKDAYGTQLDVNNTPLPQSIQNKINQIKSTGKLESVEDMIFDEDHYTMEFSEKEQAYIITDTREPELTIEQSIYGEVEESVEEESLADLFNSL